MKTTNHYNLYKEENRTGYTIDLERKNIRDQLGYPYEPKFEKEF